jgi:hypothetical protein
MSRPARYPPAPRLRERSEPAPSSRHYQTTSHTGPYRRTTRVDRLKRNATTRHAPVYASGGYPYPDNDIAALSQEVRQIADLGFTYAKIKSVVPSRARAAEWPLWRRLSGQRLGCADCRVCRVIMRSIRRLAGAPCGRCPPSAAGGPARAGFPTRRTRDPRRRRASATPSGHRSVGVENIGQDKGRRPGRSACLKQSAARWPRPGPPAASPRDDPSPGAGPAPRASRPPTAFATAAARASSTGVAPFWWASCAAYPPTVLIRPCPPSAQETPTSA